MNFDGSATVSGPRVAATAAAAVFDAMGRITQMVSQDGTSDYGYDSKSQLTSADHSYQADETYTFDNNGNRTMSGYQTGTDNRLTNDGTYSYTYDAEGNRLTRTKTATGEVTEYTWDYHNRLTKVTEKNSQGTVTQVVEYLYDVFNRRIGRKIDTSAPFDMANAVIERYVMDDIHNGLTSADGGNVVLDFVDPDGSGAQAIAMSKRYLYGEAVDQLFAQEDLSKTLSDTSRNLWPLVDHLGTVRDLVKQDGTIATHYKYDSFGNVTSGDTSKTRYLFTSREFDTATKLQYNRARYYDAAVGRWISEDPLGFAAGDANVGRYVGNNVIWATDSSGFEDTGGISGQFAKAWESLRGAPDRFNDGIDDLVNSGPRIREQFADAQEQFNSGINDLINSGPRIRQQFADAQERFNDKSDELNNVGYVFALFLEPVDWFMTGKDLFNDPTDWVNYIGILPIVPGSVGKLIRRMDEAPEMVETVIDFGRHGDDLVFPRPDLPTIPGKQGPNVPACFVAGTLVMVPSTEGTDSLIVAPENGDGHQNWLAVSVVIVGVSGLRLEKALRRRRKTGARHNLEDLGCVPLDEVDPNLMLPATSVTAVDITTDGDKFNDTARPMYLTWLKRLVSSLRERRLTTSPVASETSVNAGLGESTSEQLSRDFSRHSDANVVTSLRRRQWLAVGLPVSVLMLIGWCCLFGVKGDDNRQPRLLSTEQTSVHVPEVNSFQPIERLRVGDRVLAANPDVSQVDLTADTQVDPRTWRHLALEAEIRWPDGTLDDVHIETLQSDEWVATQRPEIGKSVAIPLDLVEMGLPDDLRATVVWNRPCPPVTRGPGRVVLTTINHLHNQVLELHVQDEHGRQEVIRPTCFHKFYSESRGKWVSAGDLGSNEVVAGYRGPLSVQSISRLSGVHRVYNITVEAEHVYHVGKAAVVAHNCNCSPADPTLGPGGKEHKKKGTTNPAKLPKHEKGKKRKKIDKRGGEKGDENRPYRR